MEVMCLAEFGEGGSLPLRLKLTDKQTRSKALRAREGLDHAPGAIVNPDAYRDGGIANPN